MSKLLYIWEDEYYPRATSRSLKSIREIVWFLNFQMASKRDESWNDDQEKNEEFDNT